jgi:mannosyltransferase OCH1-like enzyme
MNLFQIFLCDPDKLQVNLTQCEDVFAAKKQAIISVYSDCNYQLYTNPDAQEFLAKFDRGTLKAFNTLVPYALRADLLRYCLLYEYGGWYFDQAIEPVVKAQPTTPYLMFVNKARQYIENMVLYAEPRQEYYQRLIEQVVDNVTNGRYGKNPLDITGPLVMRKVYFKYLHSNGLNGAGHIHAKFKFGEYVRPDNSKGHLLIDNKLVAVSKKDNTQFGRIDYMGFVGTNNYNELYSSNSVFL